MTEEDLTLIEKLEAEGVITKGFAKRARKVERVADAVGAKRVKMTASLLALFLACGDFALTQAFHGPVAAFCGATTALLVCIGVGFFIAWAES